MHELPRRQDTNLGILSAARGAFAAAEKSLRTAIELDHNFVPAWVSLAEIQCEHGEEGNAEATLRSALATNPGAATLQHALGLSLVRQHRLSDALPLLRDAADGAPESPRFAYVHAVAVDGTGNRTEAIRILRGLLERHPNDLDSLAAIVAWMQISGDTDGAAEYGSRLLALRSNQQ